MAYAPNKNSTVHSNLLALVNHTNNSNLTEDQVEFVDPKYGLLTRDYLNSASATSSNIKIFVGAPLIENGLPKKAIYFSKRTTGVIGEAKTLVSSPMLPVAGLPVITDMDNVSLDDAKPIFGDYTFKLNPNDPLSNGATFRHLGLHEKPGFMSMISWTGNETPSVTIGHTLDDKPKSILIFKLTGTNSIENRTNGSILLHDPTEFALDSSETINTVIDDSAGGFFIVEHKNRITKNTDLTLKIKSSDNGMGFGYNGFSFKVFNGVEEIFSGTDTNSNEIHDSGNNEFLYTIPKSVFANIVIPENQSTLNLTTQITANEFVTGVGGFEDSFTVTLARDFEFGETTITLPNEILSKVDGVNTIQYLNENNAKYLALLFGHDTSETGLIECVKFDYDKGNLVNVDSTKARATHTFAGVKRKYAGILLFNANRDAFNQNGISFVTASVINNLFNKNKVIYKFGSTVSGMSQHNRNYENNTTQFSFINIERNPHYAIIFYESTEKNSKLRIKAVNNKGFLNRANKDGIVLEYNRIGVNQTVAAPVTSFITDPTTTFAQLYQLVKDSNSLFEGEFVIEEFMQYAPNGDYNDKFVNDYPFTNLTVRPKGWSPTSAPVKYSESFIYTDSVLVISLRKDQYLDVAVATKELTGFVPVI